MISRSPHHLSCRATIVVTASTRAQQQQKSQTPSSFDAGRPTAATPRFPHALPPSWRSPKAISHACRPPAVPQLPLSGAPIRCHLRYRAPVMHGSITLPFLWLIYRSIPCRCVPSLLSTGLAPPNPPNGVGAATPVRCSPELSSGGHRRCTRAPFPSASTVRPAAPPVRQSAGLNYV